MISIIICSRKSTIPDRLSVNIAETIGCYYELVVIDNSENKFSIFEAYNMGIQRSKGNCLCFVHDDILFHTVGWGNVIESVFLSDDKTGVIGVAGARSKTEIPSLWWLCPKSDKVVNIIQHTPDGEVKRWEEGFEENKRVQVAVVDGVFMAVKRDDAIRFNEAIPGFHNYDLSICFEYKKAGYKVMVTNEILIEHFSLGNINSEWFESAYCTHKIYKRTLPVLNDGKKNKELEIANAVWFISESLRYKKYDLAFFIWIKLFTLNPFLKFHLIFLKNFIKSIAVKN